MEIGTSLNSLQRNEEHLHCTLLPCQLQIFIFILNWVFWVKLSEYESENALFSSANGYKHERNIGRVSKGTIRLWRRICAFVQVSVKGGDPPPWILTWYSSCMFPFLSKWHHIVTFNLHIWRDEKRSPSRSVPHTVVIKSFDVLSSLFIEFEGDCHSVTISYLCGFPSSSSKTTSDMTMSGWAPASISRLTMVTVSHSASPKHKNYSER